MSLNSVVTWEKLIQQYDLKRHNEELFHILDSIASILKDKAFLYKKDFEFGEIINDKGKLNFDESAGFTSQYPSNLIKYSNDPLGLVLNNYIEVFVEVPNEEKYNISIPINKITAGNLFGTFGTLNFLNNISSNERETEWSVTSGSRSILMVLPNFNAMGYGTDLLKLLRIKKVSKKALDDIKYNSYKILKNFSDSFKWESNLVFFPSHWINGSGIEFSNFREYIYAEGWKQSSHLRDRMTEHSFYNELIEHK